MKTKSLFTVPFFEFDCDDDIVFKILLDIPKIRWEKSKENFHSAQYYFREELHEWLENCLDQVKKNINLSDSLDLKIINCWINKTGKLMSHHEHSHQNSFLSGILYLSTHKISGETVFSLDNPLSKGLDSLEILQNRKIYKKIFPETGKLIIFPSYVSHKVLPLRQNEIRYSISFNVFISGVVSNFPSKDLVIKVSSMRESIKNDNNKFST